MNERAVWVIEKETERDGEKVFLPRASLFYSSCSAGLEELEQVRRFCLGEYRLVKYTPNEVAV